MTSLFNFDLPPLNLLVRVVVVYIFILVALRLAGKRQIGQMSATDLVALLLISNAVQNSMNGGDNSLIAGILLAAVLVLMSWLISVVTFHSRRASLIIEGTPSLLIRKGHVILPHLKKERIRVEELRSMLRKQGIHRFEDVHLAILEADGTLTIERENESIENIHVKGNFDD